MERIIKALWVVLLGSWITTAHAAMYQVEVIAFEQGMQQENQHQWPLEPGAPKVVEAVELDETNKGFRLVPAEHNELKFTHQVLEQHKNYRILYHKAWKQNLNIGDKVIPVHLANEQFIQDTITNKTYKTFDGFLSVKPVRQGFFVKLDCILAKPSDKSLSTSVQNFRLKSSAKIKQKELYYFDHPLMGVLVYLYPNKAKT